MTRVVAVVLTGALLAAAAEARQGVPAPAAAQAQGNATTPPAATGVITGKVVDAANGAAVGEVTITLSGSALSAPVVPGRGGLPIPGGPGTRRVLTDGTGRFLFRDLPPGTYNISATEGGYLTSAPGVLRPGGTGQPVNLVQGGRALDLVIKLFKYAVISGTLTDEASDPVVGARMIAFKADYVSGRRRLTGPSVATTDDRGAFRFADLVPGDYVLAFPASSVSMPAEVLAESERARAAGPVAGNAFANDIDASGAHLFTQPSLAVGEWRFLTGTNARGPAPSENGVFVFPTTFHTGSASAQNATIVSVGSGEEKSGIDFQIRPVRTARVSGIVMGADGPAKFLGLRLFVADVLDQFASDSTLDPIISMTNSKGEFVFFGIAPGNYVLKVTKVPEANGALMSFVANGPGGAVNVTRPDPSAPSVKPSLWASLPVSVAGADVRDVMVTLKEGARISGRVEFDGATAPPPDRLRQIGVVIEPPGSGFGTQFSGFQTWRGLITPTGTFSSVQFPPGRYFLRSLGPPAGWMLDAITVNGRDVTDSAFELASSDLTDVVIRFTDKLSQLTGAVKDAQGQNDPKTSVLVFPTDAAMWTDYSVAPRRLRLTRVSSSGGYTVATLPPGDYFVIAINDAEAGSWQDPRFLTKAASVAARVTITRGQSKTLDLTTGAVK